MESLDLIHVHRKYIDRYQTLLKTRLSDGERHYIESRLSEEMSALNALSRKQVELPFQHS